MQPTLAHSLSRKIRFFSFISMLLLVFVHGYNLNNRYLQPFTFVDEPLTFTTFTEYFLANGIFRFRIPMLFIISGYLFALHDDKPFAKRIGKRFKTLMVPYFLWSVIGLSIAVAFYYWSWTSQAVQSAHLQPFDKPFSEYGIGDWVLAVLFPTSYQLWFIRCLFFYNLYYPLLVKGLQKAPTVLFVVFTLMWLSGFMAVIIEGEGLLSFTLGVWLCKKRKDVTRMPKLLSLKLTASIFILFSIAKTWLAFKGLQFMDGFALGFILMPMHKIVIASGLLTAWFGLDWLVNICMNKKWFVHLTGYSFIIYALHVPIVTYLIDPVFGLISNIPIYRFITFIFLPLLIIAFCIAVGCLLRTTLPGIYALLTGNRGLEVIQIKKTVAEVKAAPLAPVKPV